MLYFDLSLGPCKQGVDIVYSSSGKKFSQGAVWVILDDCLNSFWMLYVTNAPGWLINKEIYCSQFRKFKVKTLMDSLLWSLMAEKVTFSGVPFVVVAVVETRLPLNSLCGLS